MAATSSLERAIKDPKAAVEYLARHYCQLRRWAASICPPSLLGRYSISDVVQSALLKVFVSFPSFGGGAQRFFGWVRRIVTNAALKLIRYHHADQRDVAREDARGAQFADQLGATQPSPSTQCAYEELAQRVRGRVGSILSECNHEIFTLRLLQRFSHEEIAAATGLTKAAVKHRLRDIRWALANDSELKRLIDAGTSCHLLLGALMSCE
jgi:RNA polymerase sigma factor (sigma-70 family)